MFTVAALKYIRRYEKASCVCKKLKANEKMQKGNLQEIMNRMVSRLEGIKTDGPDSYQKDPWTEIKAYIGLDPLLGDLHKQYLDARALHKKLLNDSGKDDPMTDAAFDARASAVSAIETRVLELRKDEGLRSIVAYRMRRTQLEQQEELSAATKEYWSRIRGYNEGQNRDIAQKKREEGASNFFAAIVFLSLMEQMLRAARRNLSIASVFDAARGYDNQQGNAVAA